MSRLEEITPGAAITGILPDALVTMIDAQDVKVGRVPSRHFFRYSVRKIFVNPS
jgi:hypothetical protein